MIHKICTFMLKREKEMEEIYYYFSSPFSFVKMACQASKLKYATTGGGGGGGSHGSSEIIRV